MLRLPEVGDRGALDGDDGLALHLAEGVLNVGPGPSATKGTGTAASSTPKMTMGTSATIIVRIRLFTNHRVVGCADGDQPPWVKQPFIIVISTAVAAIRCGSTSNRLCSRTTRSAPFAGLQRPDEVVEPQLTGPAPGWRRAAPGPVESPAGGLGTGISGAADGLPGHRDLDGVGVCRWRTNSPRASRCRRRS